MKRIIAASGDEDTQLQDAISNLKDDFDYAVDGLERLSRQGANGRNDAMMIAENISQLINQQIADIASKVTETDQGGE